MRFWFSVLFVLLGYLTSFANPPATPVLFHYQLNFEPQADRTDLHVRLWFLMDKDSTVKIGLRRDYYGTGRIYNYIKNARGVGGTIVRPTDVPGEFAVSGSDTARIDYTLSFDPKSVESSTYAPNTGSRFFHAAFCQFLLSLPADTTVASYEFKVNPPPGWAAYSSDGGDQRNFNAEGSLRNVFSHAIGVSAMPRKDYRIKGKHLRVFIAGNYAISNSRLFSIVYKTFLLQHRWMNDFTFPFFTVTILPREDNVAGVNIPGMFVCHVKSDVTELQFMSLVSHEMFHIWVGKKLSIASFEGYAPATHWFTEGYNDYLSKKILLESGLISRDQFVKLINQLLLLIDESRYKNYTFSQFKKLSDSGLYATQATKLQYYRGAIMALNADARMHRSGHDIMDFIRVLFAAAGRENYAPLIRDSLYAQGQRFGLNMRDDYDRYILAGESIIPEPDAMGKGYTLKAVKVPRFSLGFTVKSDSARSITDVKPGGNAYNAGLRNGMGYVASANTNIFSNAWNPDAPAEVIVKDAGITLTFRYFPFGDLREVLQYVKNSKKTFPHQ